MILLTIIPQVFLIYRFILIGYVLMSWIPAAQESAVGRFLATLAEPYLGFFRKFIPPLGMIDISPIVAIIALSFIEKGVWVVISYLI
ncbi:YggT family protein [Bacillus ndiopicus]|uniref:YggT family protein n=1 Tax=Bacillus ndiopicus TaxID=1347368 RepID=UPI0005AAB02F|nr:YggT family protein [Bacillus ndiopicus]